LQAFTAAGVTKDISWIVDTFKDVIMVTTNSQPSRLVGLLLDNTKANRAALLKLEEWCPQLLGVGCQAHGLSLFIKDAAKDNTLIVGKCFERSAFLINTILGSEKLTALIKDKQIQVFGQVRLVENLSPTLLSMWQWCSLLGLGAC
jgi:hypothetical protein